MNRRTFLLSSVSLGVLGAVLALRQARAQKVQTERERFVLFGPHEDNPQWRAWADGLAAKS